MNYIEGTVTYKAGLTANEACAFINERKKIIKIVSITQSGDHYTVFYCYC